MHGWSSTSAPCQDADAAASSGAEIGRRSLLLNWMLLCCYGFLRLVTSFETIYYLYVTICYWFVCYIIIKFVTIVLPLCSLDALFLGHFPKEFFEWKSHTFLQWNISIVFTESPLECSNLTRWLSVRRAVLLDSLPCWVEKDEFFYSSRILWRLVVIFEPLESHRFCLIMGSINYPFGGIKQYKSMVQGFPLSALS